MKANVPKGRGMNQADMMKQIQKMQEEMERKQEEVQEAEYSASAGGGAVSVTVNGSHELLSLDIKEEVVDPEEIDMLEDLLIAAINEANRKAAEAMENSMNSVTGGLNIPGLDGLL